MNKQQQQQLLNLLLQQTCVNCGDKSIFELCSNCTPNPKTKIKTYQKNPSKFICKQCNPPIQMNKDQYFPHLNQNHPSEKKIKCPVPLCQSTFRIKYNFIAHLRRFHEIGSLRKTYQKNPSKFICKQCNPPIQMNKDQCFYHINTKHRVGIIQCPVPSCNSTFTRGELLKHLKNIHLILKYNKEQTQPITVSAGALQGGGAGFIDFSSEQDIFRDINLSDLDDMDVNSDDAYL